MMAAGQQQGRQENRVGRPQCGNRMRLECQREAQFRTNVIGKKSCGSGNKCVGSISPSHPFTSGLCVINHSRISGTAKCNVGRNARSGFITKENEV
jgi:hypothetical protein